MQAFEVGGNAMWMSEQSSAGGPWAGYWTSLGGTFSSAPAAAVNANGTVLTMAVSPGNIVWYTSQTSPDGSFLSYWTQIGGSIGMAGTPAIARNSDGRLEAFARGTDSYVYHAWQTSTNGSWSSWSSLAGAYSLSNPAVAQNADGRLEVFTEGGDGALWHIWQTSPGTWNTWWSSLGGGVNGDPRAATDASGTVEAFVKGTDNALYYATQVSAGSSSWSGWGRVGSNVADLSGVVLNSNNELQTFYRMSTDNALHYITQVSPGVWPSAPYANYQICSNTDCYTSGAAFNAGDPFTIVVTSNIPNSSFTVLVNGTTLPNFGTTDLEGNWSSSGQFSSGNDGYWTEQVEFPSVGAWSNAITFTVQN